MELLRQDTLATELRLPRGLGDIALDMVQLCPKATSCRNRFSILCSKVGYAGVICRKPQKKIIKVTRAELPSGREKIGSYLG